MSIFQKLLIRFDFRGMDKEDEELVKCGSSAGHS